MENNMRMENNYGTINMLSNIQNDYFFNPIHAIKEAWH